MNRRTHRHQGFEYLLVLQLFITPMAAAVTEPGHSLRSLLMGFYLVFISLYGLRFIQQASWRLLVKNSLVTIAFIALAVQSALYTHHYFSDYETLSVDAFESYGIKALLEEAIEQSPSRIVISANSNQPYAHLEFYQLMLGHPTENMLFIEQPLVQHDTCLLTFISEYFPDHGDSNVALKYAENLGYTRLRCYW
jgi:hypothetical protein